MLPCCSTDRLTRIGNVPDMLWKYIIWLGSHSCTSNSEMISRPKNTTTCLYLEPTRNGGSVVNSHDFIPSCLVGVFSKLVSTQILRPAGVLSLSLLQLGWSWCILSKVIRLGGRNQLVIKELNPINSVRVQDINKLLDCCRVLMPLFCRISSNYMKCMNRDGSSLDWTDRYINVPGSLFFTAALNSDKYLQSLI